MNNLFVLLLLLGLISCANSVQKTEEKKTKKMEENKDKQLDTIVLGGGCYWCLEAVFQRMNGVEKVVSGFSGGFVKNPAYREVCNGTTGHAEVIEIVYDKSVCSLYDIFKVFFAVHDPTTLNKQGADEGTQYRSCIYFRTSEQEKITREVIEKLTEEKVYATKIVTEVKAFDTFYSAEKYHQNYYNENKDQPYCQFVVKSKVEKFEHLFSEKIKSTYK